MDALSEREMRARIFAVDVETLGLRELRGIVVGGAEEQQEPRALGELDAA